MAVWYKKAEAKWTNQLDEIIDFASKVDAIYFFATCSYLFPDLNFGYCQRTHGRRDLIG